MGSTYHNTIVKGPAQAQIVATLQDQHIDALVSPTLDGLTFVYTAATVWSASAEHLSRTFHCVALFSSVYDGDYFEYQLYDDGRLVDHYTDHTFSSDPDAEPVYNEEGAYEELEVWWGPTGGYARRLCSAFGVDARVDTVEAILHPNDAERIQEWDVEALEHHATLAEAMGWPLSACLSDYDQLKREGIGASRLTRTTMPLANAGRSHSWRRKRRRTSSSNACTASDSSRISSTMPVIGSPSTVALNAMWPRSSSSNEQP